MKIVRIGIEVINILETFRKWTGFKLLKIKKDFNKGGGDMLFDNT